jgi:ribonuclease P protein component
VILPLLQPSIISLRGFGSFTRVITSGKKYERKPIKVFVRSIPSECSELRVGFTVKRGIQNAAQRNLLKRFMRESFRLKKEEFFNRMSLGILVEIVFLYQGDVPIRRRKALFVSVKQAIAELSSVIMAVSPR